MAEALDLNVILDALEVGDGRAEIHFSARQGVGQGVAHAVGVDEDHLVLVDALQEMDHIVIIAHLDVAVFEVLAHLIGNLVLIDKDDFCPARDVNKGDGDRRESDVVAAQVEQPSDIVERGDQHGRRLVAFQ